jgi:Fanconi-associated nuclease 1
MERFTKEVGEEGLHRALADLCLPFIAPTKAEGTEIGIPVKEEPDIIDLSFDEEDHKQTIVDAEAGPSSLDPGPTPGSSQISMQPTLDNLSDYLTLDSSDPDIDFFCRDQTTMTLHEVLYKLSISELKDLVKSIRIKPRKFVVRLPDFYRFCILIYHLPQKDEMISALMLHASNQSILAFTSTGKGKHKVHDDGLRQTKLPFIFNGSKKGRVAQKTQEGRLMEMALKKLGAFSIFN